MTTRRRSVRTLAAVSLAVLLGACDNARESVELGTWSPATEAEAPATVPGAGTQIELTTLEPGAGKGVMPGDLVHLRYARTVRWDDGSEHAYSTGDAWLWTGVEPDAPLDFWGDFGSPELRAALLGHSVGERLTLRVLTPAAEIRSPAYGISAPLSPKRGLNEFIAVPRSNSPIVLAGGDHAWNQPSWSELTIAASCAATLETRAGRLTQWGYHWNMFGTAYATDRAGVLRWSRLKADCAPPEGEVTFSFGPIYWRPAPWAPGTLMAWQSSYLNKVARASHPEDYDFVRMNGRVLGAAGR